MNFLRNLNPANWFSGNRAEETTEDTTAKPVVAWETIAVPSDADFAQTRSDAVTTVPKRTTVTDESCRLTGIIYAELYNRVIGGSNLGLIKTRLQELMDNGSKRVADTYAADTATAAQTFCDSCLPHVQDEAAQKVKNVERVEQLRADNKILEQQHADYSRQLTGNPTINVPDVDKRKLIAISVLVGLVVLLCDAFMGAPSFSFGSNDVLAYAMSFSFGFAYGAILYFWAIAARRMDSFEEATQNLATYKRQNPRDEKARSLELFAISKSERSTVRSMKQIFWGMSLAMLAARILVSRENTTLLAIGIMATFMIVVVSLVGFFFEKKIAPPYGSHHDHLDQIAEQIDSNDDEIEELLNPESEEKESEWLTKAKTAYIAAMNAAWKKVEVEVADAHGAVTNYRHLLGQSASLSEIIREQHIGTCHAVIGKVLEMKADRENLEKIDFDWNAQHAASFLVLPAMNDPFSAKIESGTFNPESLRPAKVAAEPNKLMQAVLANAPKPPEPPKQRQRPVVNMKTT